MDLISTTINGSTDHRVSHPKQLHYMHVQVEHCRGQDRPSRQFN
jgi:hypothetical protein